MAEDDMGTIHLTATAGADGILRLEVPAPAGVYDVSVSPLPSPKPVAPSRLPKIDLTSDPVLAELIRTAPERGWPVGFLEGLIGACDDETFVAPPRTIDPPDDVSFD